MKITRTYLRKMISEAMDSGLGLDQDEPLSLEQIKNKVAMYSEMSKEELQSLEREVHKEIDGYVDDYRRILYHRNPDMEYHEIYDEALSELGLEDWFEVSNAPAFKFHAERMAAKTDPFSGPRDPEIEARRARGS